MRILLSTYNPIRKINFKANNSTSDTVAILGSTKYEECYMPQVSIASKIVEPIIAAGKNILTDGSTRGIVGQVFLTAAEYSPKDESGKPIQNLTIMQEQNLKLENSPQVLSAYGGKKEQLDIGKICTKIDTFSVPSCKIDKFMNNSDTFVVFPGEAATYIDVTSLIANNLNSENKKKIILVGSEYFSAFDNEYQKLYESGFLQIPPSALYTIVDEADDILKELDVYQPNKVECETDLEE